MEWEGQFLTGDFNHAFLARKCADDDSPLGLYPVQDCPCPWQSLRSSRIEHLNPKRFVVSEFLLIKVEVMLCVHIPTPRFCYRNLLE